jgi:hypothetical protein
VTPFSDALIAVAPAATPVTVIAVLEAPAATVTGDVTVATAGLLLDSAIVIASAAGDVSRIEPCTVLPAAIVVAVIVISATAAPADGAAGVELHPPAASAAISPTAAAMKGVRRRFRFMCLQRYGVV